MVSDTPGGRTIPRFGSVVGEGIWTGVVAGTFIGPVAGIVLYLLSALASGSPDAGLDEDGEWGGFVFVLFFLPLAVVVLAFIGEAIGLLVGAISAATVWAAIRLEARLGFSGGPALLGVAGLAGGVLSVAAAVPILAVVYPAGLYWARDLWLVTAAIAVAAAFVAMARFRAIRPVRLALAAAELGAERPPVPRANVLRIWGSVILGLVLIATVEMAVLVSRSAAGPSCFRGGDSLWIGVGWAEWPPQVTCFYDSGAVELVPRVLYVVLAFASVLAAGLLAAAVGATGSDRGTGGFSSGGASTRLRAARRIVLLTAAALVALSLAAYSAVGAVRPVASSTADADSSLDIDPPPAPSDPWVTPAPVTPLPDVTLPPPTSTYSSDELTTLLQELVDETFEAAGPIDDPEIPVETQTFPVIVGECMEGGVPGQTAYLTVGFDTADVSQSLERVRALWMAEGYQLYERTENAKGDPLTPGTSVSARGADPQVASSLLLRIYDGYLILDVAGLCVSS
jgi:hypothetical protein